PKLGGGFGGEVVAGTIDDLRNQVFLPDGSVQPVFVAAAQSWIVPYQGSPDDSQFGDNGTIGGTGSNVGLMALWQKCVHLGCRVPDCVSSQGFECPCHGSKYNFHGEYQDGPAPRNMDRFVVKVDDNGDFVVDTGQVIQTARAPSKTALYPQGPSCV
ncbi:MAG: Rieske 2Fe-2S domain-containing protein, partial [Acidimicrobiia bacterium]|nr:Rieske 2Fe-2S domain-containing protein [Acidimicrobiia bacterium]